MLKLSLSRRLGARRRQRESGIVLVIMLIVLVAMTLAAISLVRSTDTTNVIAGNLSFQQAAVHSADAGVELATKWLASVAADLTLDSSDSTNGYQADGLNVGPNLASNPPQTWDAYWTATLAARAVTVQQQDAAKNTVSYVIDRLCANTGSSTGGASCVSSPSVAVATGNEEEAGQKGLNVPGVVYYRITVRVDGPRNSVSYVQSVVSM